MGASVLACGRLTTVLSFNGYAARRNGAVFAEARTRKRSRRRSTIAGRLAAGTSDDRVHDELFLQPPARKLAAAAHRANHAGVHQESLLSVWRKQLRFWE